MQAVVGLLSQTRMSTPVGYAAFSFQGSLSSVCVVIQVVIEKEQVWSYRFCFGQIMTLSPLVAEPST